MSHVIYIHICITRISYIFYMFCCTTSPIFGTQNVKSMHKQLIFVLQLTNLRHTFMSLNVKSMHKHVHFVVQLTNLCHKLVHTTPHYVKSMHKHVHFVCTHTNFVSHTCSHASALLVIVSQTCSHASAYYLYIINTRALHIFDFSLFLPFSLTPILCI